MHSTHRAHACTDSIAGDDLHQLAVKKNSLLLFTVNLSGLTDKRFLLLCKPSPRIHTYAAHTHMHNTQPLDRVGRECQSFVLFLDCHQREPRSDRSDDRRDNVEIKNHHLPHTIHASTHAEVHIHPHTHALTQHTCRLLLVARKSRLTAFWRQNALLSVAFHPFPRLFTCFVKRSSCKNVLCKFRTYLVGVVSYFFEKSGLQGSHNRRDGCTRRRGRHALAARGRRNTQRGRR